ncbi:MBL fold metallo-hydrolase [Kocuria coralli]|uniref:MBL fold metallo-hydrolase n=1 Tax=Kocuria coralli TaxID=1461025 RepID=A0A5J5L3L1_9MICC|nr:MBL fold metallo-hydrolase [Kocuria coralli]KAA9395676.1 MBL fold metallo-hydrolase [Kocuria coralli]
MTTIEVTTSADGRVRVENCVTSGTFSLDGGTWEVDNNVWIVGDDDECFVIDPAHDPQAVAEAVDGRTVKRILLTHGHDDHIRAALDTARLIGGQTHLNPSDRMLWDAVHPDTAPDHGLADGDVFELGGITLTVLSTPGHSPGSVCLYSPELGVVFSGDTLFQGGPGATGRSYSDFPTIVDSIRERLLPLPQETVVLTGHGDSTLIGAEAGDVEEWLARGH